MRETYIDIMRRALSAYDRERINEYVESVKTDGLKEHGFPRLTANIGNLLSLGYVEEYRDLFVEMMDLCCEQMPNKKKVANDFSVREICWCLMLAEKNQTVPAEKLAQWKQQMSEFEAWEHYDVIAPTPDTPIGNWAFFAAVSEFVRGLYCGQDVSAFVDHQVSSQLLSFDEKGMYKDDKVHPPVVYDLVPRMLGSVLLAGGYQGKLRDKLIAEMEKSDELTLQMISTEGEVGFGGRSNQFYHNEMWLAAICEGAAVRYRDKGNNELAGKFKAAANFLAEKTFAAMQKEVLTHVKNNYDRDSRIGCEGYAYFNKYMITAASCAYAAYLLADDSIEPAAHFRDQKPFFAETTDAFHLCFMGAGEYFIELDKDANPHYDATGLGKVQRYNVASTTCLSVPFCKEPNYRLEGKNPTQMSICSFAAEELGAEGTLELLGHEETAEYATAEFLCKYPSGKTAREIYTVTEDCVSVALADAAEDEAADGKIGFCLPAFAFDGKYESRITAGDDFLEVRMNNSVCRYTFDGTLEKEPVLYYNRNGRYLVYRMYGKQIHIELFAEKE